MYFVIKKYKLFQQDQYEIVKSKSYKTEHNAKKICEACETLNDDKGISFFIIEAIEGTFLQKTEAPKQLELPLS